MLARSHTQCCPQDLRVITLLPVTEMGGDRFNCSHNWLLNEPASGGNCCLSSLCTSRSCCSSHPPCHPNTRPVGELMLWLTATPRAATTAVVCRTALCRQVTPESTPPMSSKTNCAQRGSPSFSMPGPAPAWLHSLCQAFSARPSLLGEGQSSPCQNPASWDQRWGLILV